MNYSLRQIGVVVLLLSSCCFASDGGRNWDTTRFSEDVGALYKAASELKPPAGTDVLVIDTEENYVFDADGRAVHTSYQLYQVLTQKGADEWDGISESWAPWHQERPVVRARVITPDNTVHPLDPTTITDAPAREDEDRVYSDGRVIRAPLPAIAPGSLVEEEEVTKDAAPFFTAGTVTRVGFGRVAPVQRTRLIIDAPSSLDIRYSVQLLPGLKPERSESDGRVRLTFEHGPMEALEDAENYLPSGTAAYPEVTFSIGGSWQQVAEQYSKIIDRQVGLADIASTAKTVSAGKATREDKASAILQYIDREVRYTGVEFDEAAIVPHLPADTLKRKYGDCKDKASLLVAMLRSAGIPSYVALLKVGQREDVSPDLPGLGRFDHAIVYAPGSPDLWIDATDEYARLGQLPSSDEGRLALIARPETSALVKTPVSSSKDNLLLEKREFYLAENGPARVVEITEPHGSSESRYRSAYADLKDKDREKNLTEYVKSQYLAEKLKDMKRSEPRDLSTQFQLVLEAEKAGRGLTDLETSVTAIRLDSLFDRFPSELQRAEKEDKNADKEKAKKPRTADYELAEAFVTEWRYKIVPPAGFRPKPLPVDVKRSLGVLQLTEEFSADKDGTVNAVIRFDTVKRQFSIEEAREIQQKIAEVRQQDAILIYFEPIAETLLAQGKTREAFQAYRDIVALHPTEAVHHLQLAKAYLAAGMGQGAREEAKLAVKLEPKSALAEETLAEILESDSVGRKLRRGSDYAGSEAAFRAAKTLDPDDKSIVGNLAIFLEYNNEGERYCPGSKLKEAITEYQSLKPEELAKIGLKNNLAFALFYAHEFAEAKKYAEGLSPHLTSIIVGSESALHGSQAGIAEARKRTGSEADLKQVLKSAGEILMRAGQYPAAADLIEAGTAGENASKTLALASMLHKAKPRESLHFADDPAGLVMQFFASIIDIKPTSETMAALSSRNARIVLKRTDQEELDQNNVAGRQLRSGLARSGFPANVMFDIVLQAIDVKAEGDDKSGYRVTLQAPGQKNLVMYVVKEDEKYKILDTPNKPNAIGLEILDRVRAGNLAGARVLLDWLREEHHLEGGDDPLAGAAFPRFWTKGKDADSKQITLAAAAILAGTKQTAEDGIKILEQAKGKASSDAEKLNIDVALLDGYRNVEECEKILGIANDLATQFPESRRIFFDREFALQNLGRFDEANALAQDRLKRIPNDIDASRALVATAVAREDYALAHELEKQIVSSGKAEAGDLNGLAWNALFLSKVTTEDIDAAVKAAQMSASENAGILHTLGCLYAEVGKTKEAREVLIQAMDQLTLDEPESNYWYAFGRIAEQYGVREVASEDYSRVTKPKKANQVPASSYQLAQNRLRVLKSDAGKSAKR